MAKYSQQRADRIEVNYNLARALHFLGLNANAMELYELVVEGVASDSVHLCH
jgi:hypothetical protein